jgi:cell division control protein 24
MSTMSGRKKSIISASGVSIDQPVANNTLLNKAASESLYQQCSRLRTRLWMIPHYADYFRLSSSPANARQSIDPVTQLWDCLALGAPLCYLYNLLPPALYDPIEVETNPALLDINDEKEKKKAIYRFAIQVHKLDSSLEPFKVTDLINDRSSTDGFVKVCLLRAIRHHCAVADARDPQVVRSVAMLLDRLPEDVFSEPPSSPPSSFAPSTSTDSLLNDGPVPISAKETARGNIIRELVETERKYVQDMEVMQVRRTRRYTSFY